MTKNRWNKTVWNGEWKEGCGLAVEVMQRFGGELETFSNRFGDVAIVLSFDNLCTIAGWTVHWDERKSGGEGQKERGHHLVGVFFGNDEIASEREESLRQLKDLCDCIGVPVSFAFSGQGLESCGRVEFVQGERHMLFSLWEEKTMPHPMASLLSQDAPLNIEEDSHHNLDAREAWFQKRQGMEE